jgi:hypothetical protein
MSDSSSEDEGQSGRRKDSESDSNRVHSRKRSRSRDRDARGARADSSPRCDHGGHDRRSRRTGRTASDSDLSELEGDQAARPAAATDTAAVVASIRGKLTRGGGGGGGGGGRPPGLVAAAPVRRGGATPTATDGPPAPTGRRKDPRADSPPRTAPDDGEWRESLSVAETNELRARLGLKPLEVPGASQRSSSSSAPDGGGRQRREVDDRHPKDHDPAPVGGEGAEDGQWTESLSVDGTNDLRARLGLKPLDVAGSSTSAQKKDDMTWVPAKGRDGSRVATLSSFDFQFHHKKHAAVDPEDEFKEGDWHPSLSVAATNALRQRLGLRPLDAPAEGHRQFDDDSEGVRRSRSSKKDADPLKHKLAKQLDPEKPVSKYVRKRKRSPPPPTGSARISASTDVSSAAVHGVSRPAAPDETPRGPPAPAPRTDRLLASLPPKTTPAPSRFLACLPPKPTG